VPTLTEEHQVIVPKYKAKRRLPVRMKKLRMSRKKHPLYNAAEDIYNDVSSTDLDSVSEEEHDAR
jgi:hypothetical protein